MPVGFDQFPDRVVFPPPGAPLPEEPPAPPFVQRMRPARPRSPVDGLVAPAATGGPAPPLPPAYGGAMTRQADDETPRWRLCRETDPPRLIKCCSRQDRRNNP